jgi:hypothetical protein
VESETRAKKTRSRKQTIKPKDRLRVERRMPPRRTSWGAADPGSCEALLGGRRVLVRAASSWAGRAGRARAARAFGPHPVECAGSRDDVRRRGGWVDEDAPVRGLLVVFLVFRGRVDILLEER